MDREAFEKQTQLYMEKNCRLPGAKSPESAAGQDRNAAPESAAGLANTAGIVVGVSGGADSVCLLRVLASLLTPQNKTGNAAEHVQTPEMHPLIVVHVHHGIRGEAADADEAFVKALCGELRIPCICRHYDVPQIAEAEHLTEEEAGRKVRYQAFAEVAQEYGSREIAVAHHLEDQAETLLFRMARGTGLHGLAGMRPETSYSETFTILRPLLWADRQQIEDYLENLGQTWRTDATNEDTAYARNLVRHELLPKLQELNSGAIRHLAETAEDVAEADAWITEQAREAQQTCRLEPETGEDSMANTGGLGQPWKRCLSRTKLQSLPLILQKRVVLLCFEELLPGRKDVSRAHVEAVLKLEGRSHLDLPGGFAVDSEYDVLTISRKTVRRAATGEAEGSFQPEESVWPETGCGEVGASDSPFTVKIFERPEDVPIPNGRYTKWFDYDRIEMLSFRRRREGDYLILDAEGHRKALKKCMTDAKIPQQERENMILPADGSHVLWVPGVRMSFGAPVTEETKQILELTWVSESKG